MSMRTHKLSLPDGSTMHLHAQSASWSFENQYADCLRLLTSTFRDGNTRKARNANVASVFGLSMSIDLTNQGLPFLRGKRVQLDSVIAELIGFLQAADSAHDFRILGTKIWDANANVTGSWVTNENRKGADDLGRIYGVQWRRWRRTNPELRDVDQIDDLIRGLIQEPFGRRHLVSAWNPGELDEMALPPCHYAFQCFVRPVMDGKPVNGGIEKHRALDMMVHMRSADWFLGVPFNFASYALLLLWLTAQTDLKPGRLYFTFGDAHIYEEHLEAADTYLKQFGELSDGGKEMQVAVLTRPQFTGGSKLGFPRVPSPCPIPGDFHVLDYNPKPAVAAPMVP